MSGLLERAVEALRAAPAGAPGVLPRFAPRALVLGRPDDAVPVAAALAGGLRERDRAAGALLIVWPAEPPRGALGTPAASRLAARLQARGLQAVAGGRLAWLALGADELPLAERATGAVDVPSVIAVTGPRTAAADALLGDQDFVVLVTGPDDPPGLRDLAVAGLEAQGARVIARGPLDTPG